MSERNSRTDIAKSGDVLPRGTGSDGLKYTDHRYVKGSPESVKRLKKNGFDPIDELVMKYRRLEKELEYYENWRSNSIVPMSSTGKIRSYNENSAMVHFAIYDRMTKVAEALLRYAYGRVPEHLNLNAGHLTKPLVINLSPDQQSYEILIAKQVEDTSDD
jgi:hypothetical protein